MTATAKGLAAGKIMLSSALATEIAALHTRQREAVLHEGDVVILAGPGAGKTRTVVARVGYLLAITSEHRGVASITYTDAAARELSARLAKLGLKPGRRLASRTVHAFCLQHVLLPYGKIAGHPLPADFQVLDEADSHRLWADSLTEAKAYFTAVRKEIPTVTRIRRRVAAGEDVDDFTPQHRLAVHLYEKRLLANGLLDFDEMTHRAFRILRESETARNLLTSRFPHLVIDEYQDLGPVLHALVASLHTAGMTVTAVGDPDQTMFEFQGADPRYLNELAPLIGCKPVRLTLNYRSGSALVAAGRAALGADRGYTHDPDRTDPGIIDIQPVIGDLDAHAARTSEVVGQLLSAGIPGEDIAVLYPGRQTDLHELVEQELTAANIAFDHERARRMPGGPLSDLVMACAARRLSGPLPGSIAPAPPSTHRRATGGSANPPTVRHLAAMWHRLLGEASGLDPAEAPRHLARRLVVLLDSAEREVPEDDAQTFFSALNDLLSVRDLAAASRDRRDQLAPGKLDHEFKLGLTMAELAGGRTPGRIVMTTYHSAKGREFSAVVLPGLVEGLVPFYFANRGLSKLELADARRKFYVAVTRAIDIVTLIPGTQFTAWGKTRRSGWSSFVADIQREIASADRA